MPNKSNVSVYDRVYIKGTQNQDLVIEYIEAEDSVRSFFNSWRLIDLSTGEVFISSINLHDIVSVASELTSKARGETQSSWRFLEGKPPISTYKVWDQLPFEDRLRYVTSHARDLEHDFRVVNDNRDPIEVATKELKDMYNENPCFFFNPDKDRWDLDVDAL